MADPKPKVGEVIRCNYLFPKDVEDFNPSGKERNCLVTDVREDGPGKTTVEVAPITTKDYKEPALDLSPEEVQALGLSRDDSRVLAARGNSFKWPSDMKHLPHNQRQYRSIGTNLTQRVKAQARGQKRDIINHEQHAENVKEHQKELKTEQELQRQAEQKHGRAEPARASERSFRRDEPDKPADANAERREAALKANQERQEAAEQKSRAENAQTKEEPPSPVLEPEPVVQQAHEPVQQPEPDYGGLQPLSPEERTAWIERAGGEIDRSQDRSFGMEID